MEYSDNFTNDFMSRTFDIVTNYNGSYDSTLLINCLLGLLIIPKEKFYSKIQSIKLSSLTDCGINPESIINFGQCDCGFEHKPDLYQLLRRLRNAVAHFRISPIHESGKVSGYSFKDSNGFHIKLSCNEIKEMVLFLNQTIKSPNK